MHMEIVLVQNRLLPTNTSWIFDNTVKSEYIMCYLRYYSILGTLKPLSFYCTDI